MKKLFLLLTLLLITVSCEETETFGDIGENCYPDLSCNGDLICEEGLCLEPIGGLREPCYLDRSCNTGLACSPQPVNMCVVPNGYIGGYCLKNNICTEGTCVDFHCEISRGMIGGYCLMGQTCIEGTCISLRCE